MSTKPKIFNIKGLSDDLQANFRKLATDSGKTHSELMAELLSGKTVIENNGKTHELEAMIENQEGSIKDLQVENERLRTLNRDHNLEWHGQLQAAKDQITELSTEIEQLNARPAGVQLSGHQFIFEPASIQRSMQRCISQMIRKGKLNRHEPNILQVFTEKAITYYIKNEYPEVL